MCRYLAGHPPSNVGAPHSCSSASPSDGVGTTVSCGATFRDAFKKKRCLVLADGFYEWRRTKEGKVPYRIALKTEAPFAFAGIWSTVHNAVGQPQTTFAIITTESNELVAQIHHRMPVILGEEDEKDWLNPRHRAPSSRCQE